MRRRFHFRRPIHSPLLLALLLLALLSPTLSQHEQSLDAFVPASHKTVFSTYSLLSLGDLNLAKSSIAGRVAVGGNADLREFEVNPTSRCDKYTPALVVEGRLTAALGSIGGGYTIAASNSKIAHSVKRACSSRTEAYDPEKQNIRSFEEHREGLIRESGQICFNPVSGDVGVDAAGDVMTLTPRKAGFSCYSVFKTSVDALAKVKRLELGGNLTETNVLINVSGKSAALRDFAMVGFNPLRTLVTFCGIQGHVEMYNTRLHASVFAPTTEFTLMGSVLNGSIIAGHIRGQMAVLHQPYNTC